MLNAKNDIENQDNPSKKSETQWLWWIVFIIAAIILADLVFKFGLCGMFIQAFKFAYVYAKEFIGVGLRLLIAGVSSLFGGTVQWFYGLFK